MRRKHCVCRSGDGVVYSACAVLESSLVSSNRLLVGGVLLELGGEE